MWIEISSFSLQVISWYTVDDRQMGHVNQVGHLSKTPLNLLEIHEIGSVEACDSNQIWHLWPPYQKLLGLFHFSWQFHSPDMDCNTKH